MASRWTNCGPYGARRTARPRTVHSFLLPFQADALDGVDLLVVPRGWTIRSGIHRDETVPTPLDPVTADPSWWTDDTTTSGGEPVGQPRLTFLPGHLAHHRSQAPVPPGGGGSGEIHYTPPRGLPYCLATVPFVF